MANYCIKCGSKLKSDIIEGKERMVCPLDTCSYIHWDSPVPVVCAVIEQDNNVILIRNSGWPEKVFGLVSGFLEKCESPEQGIIREIKEELGLDAKVESFIGHYPFPGPNQILIAYHVTVRGEPAPGPEIAEYKKIPVEKVRAWDFGTGPAVKDWLKKRGF